MQRTQGRAASMDRHPLTACASLRGVSLRGIASRRACLAVALAAAGMLAVYSRALAFAAPRPASDRVQSLCARPRPGAATCTGMRLLPGVLRPTAPRAVAARRTRVFRQPGEVRHRARRRRSVSSPAHGYLTPQDLHAAYALPTETAAAAAQTIAVVDAFDDPTAETDLAVYDAQFGLPACTAANGCFRKVNERGNSSPLPEVEGSWAGEISIDVQIAHAICENCRVLLVEASSEEFVDLGKAVNTAVAAGATVISNSYASPEEPAYSAYAADFYDHPGIVITAASGDCGYVNDACDWAHVANFPADSPDVVAVSATKLTSSKGVWSSSVWNETGSGCSTLFSAPAWQSSLANFTDTGCGSQRSVADVAAIGDPNTGVDIYDSTPEGNGDPTGWGVWGGTSVSAPIVAGEFALAGGAHGVAYPASTLYSHLGESGGLDDVVLGGDGICVEESSCDAMPGYDGPSGVGSPLGLGSFAPGAPVSSSPPIESAPAGAVSSAGAFPIG